MPGRLAQTFLDLMAMRLPSVALRHEPGPPLTFLVPAKHLEVGDLRVYDSGDELIIDFGNLTHSHFAPYYHQHLPEEERLTEAATAAVEYVGDVLSDNRVVRVVFRDGVWSAATIFPRAAYVASSRQVGEKDFVWSGPLT